MVSLLVANALFSVRFLILSLGEAEESQQDSTSLDDGPLAKLPVCASLLGPLTKAANKVCY